MKAALLKGLEQPLEIVDLPIPEPGTDEVIIELKAAALNKRDYWITKGKYPGLTFPLVLGSDGAGKIGSRDVIFDPGLNWGPNPNIFTSQFRIIGMPDQGTLAEFIAVPKSNIYEMPQHLSYVEASALPVCGVTAFRACVTRGRAQEGERMLITGIGGGVASMALLFGNALGLDVWVTSSLDHKIDLAVEYGATGGVNYTRPQWEKELMERAGKFDIVIDGAGGDDFANLIHIMNPGGRIVVYGGTRGAIDGLSPQRIFWKQLDILGSSMGSPQDFRGMLDLVNKYQIKPVVSHVFSLDEINEAMTVLAKGDQFGKICIDLGRA